MFLGSFVLYIIIYVSVYCSFSLLPTVLQDRFYFISSMTRRVVSLDPSLGELFGATTSLT